MIKTLEPKVLMTNMATCHNVLERCEDIIKPKYDDRLYRGLVLNNKMKVLLISDPRTTKSAAALNVDIGFMCDPDDLPGLAHLCEHMLLQRTEDYFERNDCRKYISENAGSINSSTFFDHTIFNFDVNSTKLMGALERFAQFFLTPLFTESMIELELNTIHAEYLANSRIDNWRLTQLQKCFAKCRHPFSKFGAGNKQTLDELPKKMGINVRQRLLEFYEKYYSANVMSLCVLGAESLDKLEEMVVSIFSRVQNKEIDIPICSDPPFGDEHFRTKLYMVSIQNKRILWVAFPIPDLQEHYQSKPLHYFTHLLNHEGSGSFSLTLKNRGWATFMNREEPMVVRGFDILKFGFCLTEEGLDHVDEIVTLMFQYINMIKKHGSVEWIYNEYRDLAEMKFRFMKKQQPLSYVSFRAVKLRKYPMKEILCGDYLFTQWKPELIDAIMKSLTPKNIRIYVTAKAYEDVANETEYWYGTKYKKEKISTEIIDMWENAGYNSEFYLPVKNEFIPSRLDLKPRDDKEKKFPTIIADTPFVKMWFKQDDEYFVPKAKMFVRFVSPYIQINAVEFHLGSMHVDLSQAAFSQYAYPAGLAGLFWSFDYSLKGITLSIYGYDDKQYELLEKIMDRLLNFNIYVNHMERMMEYYVSELKYSLAQQPYVNVSHYLGNLLYEPALTRDELLRTAPNVTVDKYKKFIPQLFSKMHVECLIHGNMIEKEALDIARMIESKLKSAVPHITPLERQQLIVYREVRLNEGHHFLFQTENTLHKISCTTVYYQMGMQSTESNMLLNLLTQIINEPCYNTLRTQEQLGYLVFAQALNFKLIQALALVVQSEKHPRYVQKRIDSFIDSMLDYITNMSKEKFEKHKNSLVTLRLKKSKGLFAETDMFWDEITKEIYNLNRVNIETAYVKTVTQEQLLNFFKENIHGPARRKLSLHVISTIRDNDKSEEKKDEFDDMLATGQVVEIKDISLFKRSQTLCPPLEPYEHQFTKKFVRSSVIIKNTNL